MNVTETDAEVGRATIRQRLAENNRLWIVCLVVVVLCSLYFVRVANRGTADDEFNVVGTVRRSQRTYDDPAHREFQRSVLARRYGRVRALEARFTGPDTFMIALEGDTNRDDVEFLARMVGERILHRFHFRPVIHAYGLGPNGTSALLATARWEPGHGFVTKRMKSAP